MTPEALHIQVTNGHSYYKNKVDGMHFDANLQFGLAGTTKIEFQYFETQWNDLVHISISQQDFYDWVRTQLCLSHKQIQRFEWEWSNKPREAVRDVTRSSALWAKLEKYEEKNTCSIV